MTSFADPSTFPSVLDAPVDETESTTTPAATPEVAAPTFISLGLPKDLVRALNREGITTPFPIQQATVPDALAGRDVLGRGQTGSGKTLAFGLPMLARMAAGGRARPLHPRALVLVPTRELAMQVNDALMPLGKSVGVFLKTAVGGVPYDRQIDSLRRGVEIIVATPGRLGDLISRGVCNLDDIEVTVLDEADQMADMGFLPDVTELLAKTPAGAQRLLFSATLDGDVDTLVKRFMTDPVTHSTAPPTAAVSTMDHHLLLIPPHDKFAVAASIAARQGRTMMFARTQMGVDRLVEQFAAVGVRAGALHGGKTQRVRTRTLAEFKEGRMNVLVATDVAARGIHVDGVSLVVHVDPPKDPKDYLHRAGRTARAGESGAVATLVLPKQRRTTLAMLEKAGVEPAQTRVRSGDAALTELTGAQEPSGVPVVDEPAPPRRGERRHGDRPRGERRFGDRPTGGRRFEDRPQGERRFGDRPQGERRFGDRPTGERRFEDRPQGERRFGDRDRADRGERRSGDGNFGERRGSRPGGGWHSGDRQGGYRHEGRARDHRDERPRDDRSWADRPRDERAATGERRFSGRRPTRTH
ncbi:DEAD/DEAH box helicase [Micromonospora polyrhachis]|uniref:Superfamily II DNA/RNA helicase n=1 Tax=Micromonospora polyrhachis TaxID=1282883 RepID=A0A7W7SQU2_9ACTN|nr:DEAD/DEAH box helicase [Micromonospora polyrhachis]MBB4958617.1 superfamily II DNA/RNA helicase [Micromonospora polyrhachis]